MGEPLEHILARIDVGFATLDGDWRLRYANGKVAELTGRSSAELVGRKLWEALPGTAGTAFRRELERAVEERTTVQVDFHHRSRGIWVECRAYPTERYLALFLADITERKAEEEKQGRLLAREQSVRLRAEAAERRSAFLAEASALLTASLDYDETLSRLARLTVPRLADYCLLFGVGERRGEDSNVAIAHGDAAKEPLLRRLVEIYRALPDNPRSALARVVRSGRAELLRSPFDDVERSGDEHSELEALYRELGPRSVMMLPLAARGQILGVLSLSMAQSGRGYEEADLVLAGELAHRAALAMDNARLYRELEVANRSKDRFLATLSHELRTPLTPLLAVVSSLEENADLALEVRERLAIVRRNAELEARLIDDLLDLTRVAQGKLDLDREVVDVKEVLEQVLQEFRLESGRRGGPHLDVEVAAGDYRVEVDARRLTQVFWNLLSNAGKFTPPSGRVRVRARVAEEPGEEGRHLSIEISDDGIGIEPEHLRRIFEVFEQGRPETSRRFGGLGLGLAISRAIVELHGGHLGAESAGTGSGATFRLELPAPLLAAVARSSCEAVETARPAGPAAADDHGLRILLVEDHGDTAEALATLLGDLGHRVTRAATVAGALEAAAAMEEEGGIDLVLSDLGLPDGDGAELMRSLRGTSRVRGIAVSGYGMEEDLRRSREAGFHRHLTKPVTFRGLAEAIQEVMEEV